MVTKIYPSENDVGENDGDGNLGTEENLSFWAESFQRIISLQREGTTSTGQTRGGFEVLSTSGLTATLANGTAVIDGRTVEETGQNVISLEASKHNHIYYRLDKSNGLATGATFVNEATLTFEDIGTPPDDAVLLYNFKTSSNAVELTYNYKNTTSGLQVGTYIGNGTDARNILTGFRPKLVIVTRRTTPRIWACSEIGFPSVSGSTPGLIAVELDNTTNQTAVRVTEDTELRPSILHGALDGFRVDGASAQAVEDPWYLEAETTWNPGAIDNGGTDTTNVTVSGAVVGDLADGVFFPASESTGRFESAADVKSDDTVQFALTNRTGLDDVDLPSGTLRIRVAQRAKKGQTISLNDSGIEYQFCAIA